MQRLANAVRSRQIDTFIKPFDGVRNDIGRFSERGCFRVFPRQKGKTFSFLYERIR